MTKTVKAWALLDDAGLAAGTSASAVGLSVYPTEANARSEILGDERVVPCTITYQEPKRKKALAGKGE